jgi:hypothetical protein
MRKAMRHSISRGNRDVWAMSLTRIRQTFAFKYEQVRLTRRKKSFRLVKRAADVEHRSIADVGVNHCRGNVLVSEQLLHRADVVAALQQVCGKAVPEGVAAGGLGNTGGSDGVFHGVLQVFLRHMVPALFAAAWIERELISRKGILPDPFARGVWILAVKSGGKIDRAASTAEILPM